MEALMLVLLGWISLQTSYVIPPPSEFPEIRYRTEAELAKMGGESFAPGEVKAVYREGVIFVTHGFDPILNMDHRAALLHELAHFAQEVNHANFSCLREGEYEAHRLEWKWRTEHGLPPQISPVAIAMYSMCIDELDELTD